ncbi:uncharacterized protein LOC112467967 [Temnothorax curvispinosus]|uniref:Uncharacterized protein LOC112467967 n=1 Tax=Temnothorax curvispinosus TaxID=300111 RepID=A0A6J1REK0_9HYME|nr:uncharacterized protein LOC112467967 [Temnothorax curvispinosus]
MIFIFEVNRKKIYKLKRNLEFAFSLPGVSILSSFVNSLQIAYNYKDLLNHVDSIIKKYGNLTRLIYGTNVFVVLAKPEDYKCVLANINGNYKGSVTKSWERFLGNGLARTSGIISEYDKYLFFVHLSF